MNDSKTKLKELEAGFREKPGDADTAIRLARAHLEAGNSSRAREVLDKVLKSDESHGEALALRSEVFAAQNDWVQAYRDCRGASKAGYKMPLQRRAKIFYLRWLIISNHGWRPEPISRITTLVMCLAVGFLTTAMGVRLLFERAYIGFLLSVLMGAGFFWGGLTVGGISLWLKKLQDKRTPGWDKPITGKKKE